MKVGCGVCQNLKMCAIYVKTVLNCTTYKFTSNLFSIFFWARNYKEARNPVTLIAIGHPVFTFRAT